VAFRILLAEDNPADAELIAEALDGWTRTVDLVHAANGREALEHLHSAWRPDILLLDLNMPKVDGLDVLEALEDDEELRTIPTIVLTSSASPADVRAAYERHANTFFQKPMQFDGYEKLLALIEKYWADTALRSS